MEGRNWRRSLRDNFKANPACGNANAKQQELR